MAERLRGVTQRRAALVADAAQHMEDFEVRFRKPNLPSPTRVCLWHALPRSQFVSSCLNPKISPGINPGINPKQTLKYILQ